MSKTITLGVPPWEDEGVLPEEGSRNFVAGTKPKAKHFDALFTAIRLDHVRFAELLEKYGTAEFFTFDAMITMAETETGQAPGTAVVGKWPAWKFAADAPDEGVVEEVYIYPRCAGTEGLIWLLWSTPSGSAGNVVWRAEVCAMAAGSDLDDEGEIVGIVATPAIQPNVLNVTEIEFGPLAGEDMFLAIRIYRDAASVDDGEAVAHLHSVGMLIA